MQYFEVRIDCRYLNYHEKPLNPFLTCYVVKIPQKTLKLIDFFRFCFHFPVQNKSNGMWYSLDRRLFLMPKKYCKGIGIKQVETNYIFPMENAFPIS